jgi:hypothetical protein
MQLFISYARVDHPYCVQIVEIFENPHEVWYDRRLLVGQLWWEEIKRQITICDGFVYLLSPESIKSKYCRKEFEIALMMGKPVFPIRIHKKSSEPLILPKGLEQFQEVDISKGLTPHAVKALLMGIYDFEQRQRENCINGDAASNGKNASRTPSAPPFEINPKTLMSDVRKAMEEGNYDKAVFLLKQAKEADCEIEFVDLDGTLQKTEALLERQSYLRNAKKAYEPIVEMVKNEKLREQGLDSFKRFRKRYSDYDPEGFASLCLADLVPELEWCDVTEGEVAVVYGQKTINFHVDAFKIGKYPITNAQFKAFVQAKDGYANPEWWKFSPHAQKWHEENPKPAKSKFAWGDHPFMRVSWYGAMAFCRWFNSHAVNFTIALPTEQQWQRAAQGDDGRTYPWGNRFSKKRCNSKEGGLRMTSAVTEHPTGKSPFDVYDMAGNIWEWCDSVDYEARKSLKRPSVNKPDIPRAVRGGSFVSMKHRLKTTYHFFLPPHYRYLSIGFRAILIPKG